jgi:heme/copper-type cytochrome/quinol oxidase subunit 3
MPIGGLRYISFADSNKAVENIMDNEHIWMWCIFLFSSVILFCFMKIYCNLQNTHTKKKKNKKKKLIYLWIAQLQYKVQNQNF